MRSGGIFDLAILNDRISELDALAEDPEFWNDPSRARKVLKEKAGIEGTIRSFQELADALEEADMALELGEEDPDLLEEGETSMRALAERVRVAEVERMLGEEADRNDAVIEINKGAGGTDAADWADMLRRMYLRWCERRGFKTKVTDIQLNPDAGINSVTIEVKGDYAYGYLKAEIGVHRLVRISPFDASARRHTAFASVDITPDIDDDIEIQVAESEVRIDTYRASGAGGQHVNTTDSAVRITHLATNIVAACQAERSQHKNRAKAWKMLRAKLYQHELERRQAEADQMHAEKKRIEWGSQIRSYVLQPYRLVKDVRTGTEIGNTDKVLDGHLDPFMEAWLVQRASGDEG